MGTKKGQKRKTARRAYEKKGRKPKDWDRLSKDQKKWVREMLGILRGGWE